MWEKHTTDTLVVVRRGLAAVGGGPAAVGGGPAAVGAAVGGGLREAPQKTP